MAMRIPLSDLRRDNHPISSSIAMAARLASVSLHKASVILISMTLAKAHALTLTAQAPHLHGYANRPIIYRSITMPYLKIRCWVSSSAKYILTASSVEGD